MARVVKAKANEGLGFLWHEDDHTSKVQRVFFPMIYPTASYPQHDEHCWSYSWKRSNKLRVVGVMVLVDDRKAARK